MAMMNLLLPWRWKHRFSAVLDEKLKSSRDTATQQISNACELLLRQTAQEISNAWELLLRQTAQEISNACELLLRQTAQEMSNSCEQVAQQFAIGFNELGTTLQKYRTEQLQEISRLRNETYYLRQALLKNEIVAPDLSTQPVPINSTQPVPTNFQLRDRAAIDEDVRLALQYRDAWDDWMRGTGINPTKLSGLTILEIGPGINYGPPLIFAGRGARMIVTDRYLAPWDADYHPEFYRRLRTRLEQDASALDAVIEANGYPADVLTLVASRAEELTGVASGSIDLVISNATLEHINDMAATARASARVTKPGGLGIHLADYRDHRNFDRPLEFLLIETATLESESPQAMGNRLRPSEIARYFRDAGFETEITPFCEADVTYLEEFIPRLRTSRSHYRDWAADELKVLGATLVVRKGEMSINIGSMRPG
jgi:SAM-dependent methyltransferase